MSYLIHESNLERLEKKITTIKNKCIKNRIKFTYNILGEKFCQWTNSDGEELTGKFYEVEVEGSIKHDGWRFVAVIEHHGEAGNVIRAMDTELEIPERFRTCGPECEHCNRIRSRKDTYVVYNEETKEFKQVGKQCMQEYTNGLDAEDVARYISLFDEMIKGEAPYTSSYKRYLEVNEVLRFAAECFKHFGYEKRYEDDLPGKKTTRGRVSDYMHFRSGRISKQSKEYETIEEEMTSVNFDENSEYAVNFAKDAIEWLKSEKDDNGYISNLKVIVSNEYAETRDFGLIVSIPIAYSRHLGYVKEQSDKAEAYKAQLEKDKLSDYVGEVKGKVTVPAKEFRCVTTLYSQFGTTYLYKWVDTNDNIFVWYASNPVVDEDLVIEVTGTVKEHSEYRGAKQTVLTRCKVVRKEKEEPQKGTFNLDDITYPWEEN